MNTYQIKTPVALIIFKRPDTTAKVLAAIREAKPPKLFVIADGPRIDRPDEIEKCAAARAIIEQIDWECEVIKNYSDTNLGCAKRVSSGIDWVFSHVEEAIILEDDCVPHPSFFRFCEELLERYRYDTRIAAICGDNSFVGSQRTNYSYYFSRYNPCWGWASWRRAWQNYDLYMRLWPEIRSQGFLKDILKDDLAVKYWDNLLEAIYKNPLGITWDYQWTFACWLHNCVSIVASVNLISNIGFGIDSTHFTDDKRSLYENLPTTEIQFPLKHPPFVIPDYQADKFKEKYDYQITYKRQLKADLKKLIQTIKRQIMNWKMIFAFHNG